MANRLIRDGILESEAVLSLPVEGRWLFMTILLSADDLGLFEATSFRLARKADIRRELADKLLQMIADSDLVRLYQHSGKNYGFIPRFRQRLQIKRSKHPLPDAALMADDEDAVNKINDLASKTTVGQQLDNGCTTVAQPSEPEPEPEVIPSVAKATVSSAKLPPCPHTEIIDLFGKHLPELPQPKPEMWTGSRAKALSSRWKWLLTAKKRSGESYATNREEALAWIGRYFAYVAGSDFLTGRTGKFNSCDLGWLVNEANFAKVLQGNYDNKEKVAA